jgi:hypothetical protein
MPYATCTACKLTAFTAAYRWHADYCARCGTELPRPRTAAARAREPVVAPGPRIDKRRPGTALQHTRPHA